MKKTALRMFMFLLVAIFGGTARAGDTSLLNIIGFSVNSKYFAFEEFGIQDGSAFPYSNIFIVDIATNQFVEGTPVRMRIDEETAPLSAVRALSLAKVAPAIERLGLARDPGMMLVYNPASEIGSNPAQVDFRPFIQIKPVGIRRRLEISPFEMPVRDECKDVLKKSFGFRLTLRNLDDKTPAKVIHEDKGSLPESRGCATGYRIGAVVTSMLHYTTLVALIEVESWGFEDNNGRWMAVPLIKPEE